MVYLALGGTWLALDVMAAPPRRLSAPLPVAPMVPPSPFPLPLPLAGACPLQGLPGTNSAAPWLSPFPLVTATPDHASCPGTNSVAFCLNCGFGVFSLVDSEMLEATHNFPGTNSLAVCFKPLLSSNVLGKLLCVAGTNSTALTLKPLSETAAACVCRPLREGASMDSVAGCGVAVLASPGLTWSTVPSSIKVSLVEPRLRFPLVLEAFIELYDASSNPRKSV
mmetsp:Transcript_65327/g.181664  ORF Transcript_65327/g.181664 Transcript_65327/m.181664 type:complete len:223 (-) Transcript_65327:140-808(-)